jgi:hypothetical protein
MLIDSMVDVLGGARICTVLDAAMGYHQFTMDASSNNGSEKVLLLLSVTVHQTSKSK